MFKSSQFIKQQLLKLPESGMGYQIINATFDNQEIKECVVFNASFIEPANDRRIDEIFKSASYNFDHNIFESSVENEIIHVELKSDFSLFKSAENMSLDESKGALNSPIENTRSNEYFIRFSHYENDLRIDYGTKSLLPGTFSTTFKDAKYCLENSIDPISRYALPSLLIIQYAFHIKPIEKTPIQKGIVEPANNQIGGGVEVYFPKGTTPHTVIKTETL